MTGSLSPALSFEAAAHQFRQRGISITSLPGEYAVTAPNRETLSEAIELAEAMAREAPAATARSGAGYPPKRRLSMKPKAVIKRRIKAHNRRLRARAIEPSRIHNYSLRELDRRAPQQQSLTQSHDLGIFSIIAAFAVVLGLSVPWLKTACPISAFVIIGLHCCAGFGTGERGNRIVKVVPSDSVEVTSTMPSCPVTISFTMKRPSPSPRLVDEDDGRSLCTNGSKIEACKSGGSGRLYSLREARPPVPGLQR